MKTCTMRLAGIVAALMLPLAAAAQSAESYPTKPIRIIVPFTPGGIVDSISRIVGERLSAKYGQTVLVENHTGAGGAIGTGVAAKAAPDGYTLLCVSPGHAVLPSLRKDLPWDPVRDFRAVEGLGIIPNVFVVLPSMPIHNMTELIAMAKKDSAAPITYATAGIGTSNHLSGELLAQMTHTKLTQVPYKGQPKALTDLLAGRVTTMPLTAALAKPYLKSGKLRGLAVTTPKRSSAVPDLPTVAEALNLPDYEVSTWFGFVAPKKTPDAIVAKLSTDIAEILAQPEVRAKLAAFSMDVVPRNPADFDAYIASEVARWSKVIKAAGIEAQ